MTRWRTTGDQSSNGLLPLFSIAWLFLSLIENTGEHRFVTVFCSRRPALNMHGSSLRAPRCEKHCKSPEETGPVESDLGGL